MLHFCFSIMLRHHDLLMFYNHYNWPPARGGGGTVCNIYTTRVSDHGALGPIFIYYPTLTHLSTTSLRPIWSAPPPTLTYPYPQHNLTLTHLCPSSRFDSPVTKTPLLSAVPPSYFDQPEPTILLRPTWTHQPPLTIRVPEPSAHFYPPAPLPPILTQLVQSLPFDLPVSTT
jgi:hypothetical protein